MFEANGAKSRQALDWRRAPPLKQNSEESTVMPAQINIIGQRFGKLLVKADAPRRIFPCGQPRRYSLCLCDCGSETIVANNSLRSGGAKSCGCFSRETTSRLFTTHGKRGHELYRTWHHIKQRCESANSYDYPDYGGRGIKVCERWKSFNNFLSDMGQRPPGTSLDRIDFNGNYEPNNCRWATALQQAQNKRNNRYLTFNGETQCYAEWGRRTGISQTMIGQRIKKGWSVKDTLTTPLKRPMKGTVAAKLLALQLSEQALQGGEAQHGTVPNNVAFSPAALAKIAHLRTASPSTPEILPKFPQYPEEIRKRFPSAVKEHEDAIESWRVKACLAITGGKT